MRRVSKVASPSCRAPRRASGRAIAERLGQEGAAVVAVDINGDGAGATAKAIGGKSFAVACDIGDEDAVAKLFHGPSPPNAASSTCW